jgi:putative DNA primase/helicase
MSSSPDARLRELAALDSVAYERRRRDEAKRLGIRTAALDKAVAAAREDQRRAADHLAELFPTVEPWATPVDGAALLESLEAAITRHVALAPAAATAVAAWIVHTYVFDVFNHTPRLLITSPAPRCGKSTLLELLRVTCRRPLLAANTSAAAVFRIIEAAAPSLLIDEADSFLATSEELRGILNAGFEANGRVLRVEEVQGDFRPRVFRCFAPVALAGIGRMPGTLEDRSIPIVLQRAEAELRARLKKLRAPGAREALAELARQCARWAADNRERLALAPDVPAALNDRQADIAVPLLSIADLAGGVWPDRLRRALLTLFGSDRDRAAVDLGSLLLADCHAIFAETGALRITSGDLASRLVGIETSPWAEIAAGRPITPHRLAKLLAPFGIRPATIRVGREISKGYLRADFEAPWRRYLPSLAEGGGLQPLHRYTPSKTWVSGENATVTPPRDVTVPNAPKPAENLGCNDVTVANPPLSDEEGAKGWSVVL